MIIGRFCLGMKVLAWYIDMNGIETKILSNTHALLVYKKRENFIIDIQMVSKKDAASILNTRYMYHGNAICLTNVLQC